MDARLSSVDSSCYVRCNKPHRAGSPQRMGSGKGARTYLGRWGLARLCILDSCGFLYLQTVAAGETTPREADISTSRDVASVLYRLGNERQGAAVYFDSPLRSEHVAYRDGDGSKAILGISGDRLAELDLYNLAFWHRRLSLHGWDRACK